MLGEAGPCGNNHRLFSVSHREVVILVSWASSVGFCSENMRTGIQRREND